MKHFLLFLVTLACSPLLADDKEPAPPWEPAHTWVFAVGLCEWQHKEIFEAMPKRGRLEPRIVAELKERGLPADHVVYLEDQEATRLRIGRAFEELLRKTAKDDFLMVYFQGHGYWTPATGDHYFACYDAAWRDQSGWSVGSIYDAIEDQKSLFLVTGRFEERLRLGPARGPHDAEAGRHVQARSKQGDGWYKAEVVKASDRQTEVHFLDDDRTEWVTEEMLRPYEPKNLAPGTKVLVCNEDDADRKKKHWFPATVKRVFHGLSFVHYDEKDKGDHWDEWASPDRIKMP